MNSNTDRKVAGGVTKANGVATLAAVLNAADEWVILDHTEIEGAWIAHARLGCTVVTGTNVDINIDAFETEVTAHETLARSINTAVGLGLFVKDRGTYEPGTARPEDMAEVGRAIAEERAKLDLLSQLRERMQAGEAPGDLLSLFSGNGSPALPMASDHSDEWRPGMYL